MRTKKPLLFFVVAILLIVSGILIARSTRKESSSETTKEISPAVGTLQTFISTTGTVLPKNRLQIKPTVSGRIDQILVQEGDKVKKGQVLAWMSSTERAALIDAAQDQGAAALKYWQEVYKPISLLSPIDGEVIVATTQPGQTMTASDDVVVLSDRLIVRAQVDETDIGKIKQGQSALVSLDAYPDTKIKAAVDHIYYESTVVNNVTIYNVDLVPEKVPLFFRSGMNATVDFIEHSRDNALLIPLDAVHQDKGTSYVLLPGSNGEPMKAVIKVGISDDKNVEVLSGLGEKDRILVKAKKYSLPKNAATGTNPFLPQRRRQ